MKEFYTFFANTQLQFIHFIRIAIFIVMVWIGGLKAFQYEADGIVPFVSNSPFMSFFYNNSNNTLVNEEGKEVAAYTLHKNPEGKTVKKILTGILKTVLIFFLWIGYCDCTDWFYSIIRYLVS